MILKQDEKGVYEDLKADTDLQEMARLGPEGTEYVDQWVSYYACEYDCIKLTDARVFEILTALNKGEAIEFEGEEPERMPWENPMNSYEQNKREYQLSYGPETYDEENP